MDIKIQEQVRAYLDVFYVAIYRVRLLIEMSKKIGDYSESLKSQDLWGFFQNNLIVGAIVIEVFSLFDKKNSSMIKQFAKLLKSQGQAYITSNDISAWISSIEKYDSYRHKILAHKEPNPPRVEDVMYVEFLNIVDQLEKKLLQLEANHLKEINSKKTWKIASSLCLDSPMLLQFEQALADNCEPIKINTLS